MNKQIIAICKKCAAKQNMQQMFYLAPAVVNKPCKFCKEKWVENADYHFLRMISK